MGDRAYRMGGYPSGWNPTGAIPEISTPANSHDDRDKADAPEARSASGPETAAGHENKDRIKPDGGEATAGKHSNGAGRDGDNGRARTRVRREDEAHIP